MSQNGTSPLPMGPDQLVQTGLIHSYHTKPELLAKYKSGWITAPCAIYDYVKLHCEILNPERIGIINPVPHKEIMEFFGMPKPTFYRALDEIRKAGWIVFDGTKGKISGRLMVEKSVRTYVSHQHKVRQMADENGLPVGKLKDVGPLPKVEGVLRNDERKIVVYKLLETLNRLCTQTPVVHAPRSDQRNGHHSPTQHTFQELLHDELDLHREGEQAAQHESRARDQVGT